MTEAGPGGHRTALRGSAVSAAGGALTALLLAVSAWCGMGFGTGGLIGAGDGSSAGGAVARWIAVLLLVVALVEQFLRFPRRPDPDDPPEAIYRTGRLGPILGVVGGFGGLGRFAGLRMLAAGALLCLAIPRSWGGGGHIADPAGVVCATLAVAAIVGTIAVEPFVVRLLRLPAPYATGLPGLPRLPARTRVAWLIAPASLLTTVLTAVLAAIGLPGWLLLAVSVVGGLPIVVLVRQVRVRRRVAARIQRGLTDAVARYAPEFVLYTARPDDASYQVIMWLPYLARAGRKYLIVTRNELPAEAIASLNDVPVVCCRGVADLDLIMTESLRAAFYVNASSGNGALIRYHQLTHVYLGHGDSEKPPSYNPTHAMYDQIFTAGPAANRRYGAHGVLIDDSKFRVVGRPQVEVIRQTSPERTAERVAGAPPVILYAPTWRGHVSETALSSLDRAESIVGALLDRGARVIFRPHPFSYGDGAETAIIERVQAMLAADERNSGRRHRYGPAAETDLDALGCMNLADVMISDVSAVVSDFLFSGKPLAMVAPPPGPSVVDSVVVGSAASPSDRTAELDDFVGNYPVARAAYLIDHDLDRLAAVLDELLLPTGDRLAEVRADVRSDYLGDFPVDGYADAFTRAVQAACDNPAPMIAEVAESDDGSTVVSRDTIRRNLDSLARTMITGLAAVVSLAAALGNAPWVGLIAAAIGVGVAVLTFRDGERAATPLDGPRMILLLAAGAAIGVDGGPALLAAIGTILIIVAAATESAVREGWDFPAVVADGLPGLSVPSSSPTPRRLALAGVTLVALGWVLALTPPIFGWLWLVLAVGYVIMITVALRGSRRRLAAAVAAEASVRPVLERMAPEFCVYFGSGIGAGYQVGMWLPYFIRIGRPFLIVTRSLPMLTEITALTRGTGVPVLYRPTLRSLEDVVVPSMKVAFYVNNAVRNTHLIERRELTHVWLNHGDSEKPACFNPVHAIYDKIFAAGRAAVDRYGRHNVIIPAEKFMIVGRPQTEAIRPAETPIAEVAEPTVLYAPTWQGPYADSRVYSLPLGREIVAALLRRGVRVIFRAHPFNYRFAADRALIAEIGAMLDEDRRRSGREHLWGAEAEQQMSVEDCFNASDAMVTDVSAVISDYLASGKPFAVVAVGRTESELVAEAPAAAAGYPIADDLGDLDDGVDQLLITDPKGAERQQMRRYYLGDFTPGHAADGFLAGAAELLTDRVRA